MNEDLLALWDCHRPPFQADVRVKAGHWNTLITIGLVSFVAIFGGALTGLFVRGHLPEQQTSRETQSAVTAAVAVIGTLSALVLGLMISAASSSFTSGSPSAETWSITLTEEVFFTVTLGALSP
jgi:hypothetical protein